MRDERPHDSYVDQVKTYCVATDKDHGFLIVVYLIEAAARAYRLDFTPEELNAKAEEMMAMKALIEKSLDAEDPYLLTALSPKYGWECVRCEYREGCVKMIKPAEQVIAKLPEAAPEANKNPEPASQDTPRSNEPQKR